MNNLIDNWYVIFGVIALIVFVGVAAAVFFAQPTESQLKKIKAWLLLAVTQAEAELGSGTGELKLRYVYDLFITRFTWLARIISFDLFATLVDQALDEMREMLKNNPAVMNLVDPGGDV
ncbi:hypothetical protein [Sporosarcina sp. FSL W7-1283]|uniref:hypothetical protein n=1 Tax=Sporosarcina sp. FSL W7-1283 TaxID=2921560 RepID=UPI0030F89663